MILQVVFAFALLGLAGLMLDFQLAAWRIVAAAADELPPRTLRYARAKHRRRMLAASAIGVAGALIAVYSLVPQQLMWLAVYSGTMISCVAVMLICAGLDMMAGARFYREAQSQNRLKQAEMLAELQRNTPKKPAASSGPAPPNNEN